MRGEVEDLQVGCEEALATANSSLATLEDRGGDIAGAQLRWGPRAAAGGHAILRCMKGPPASCAGAWV